MQQPIVLFVRSFILLCAMFWKFSTGIWVVDTTENIAFVGGKASLACNTTPPVHDDSILLVIWYREDLGIPIYSIDSRSTYISKAKHFVGQDVEGRVTFNITFPVSYLRLAPVLETDEGQYRCRVDFKRGRTINRILTLKVTVPVASVAIFDNENNPIFEVGGPYNEGEPVNLTCKATGGRPSPKVTWWRDSNLVDDSHFVVDSDCTINVLTLTDLKPKDLMTTFVCQASNSNIMAPLRSSIKLDLNLKPKEVKISKPLGSLIAEKAIKLACQSKGSKPPARISWRKDSIWMDEEEGETESEDGFITTNFITLVPSVEDNGRRLSCIARNPSFPNNTLEDGFLMDVHYAPIASLVLGSSSKTEEIQEGNVVFFQCNVQANPGYTEIGWSFNGEPISSRTGFVAKVDTNSLLIGNVSQIHSGDYQCWAKNPMGLASSETVSLNVQYAPKCLNKGREHIGIPKQKEVVMTCHMDSMSPDIKFSWSFQNVNGDTIELEDFSTEGKSSALRFVPQTEDDYGTVYCRAENSVGPQAVPCTYFLYPEGPPDSPQNCSFANISTTQLVVECLPGYNGGLDQKFHLEVFFHRSQRFVANFSSLTSSFKVFPLPPGESFSLSLYASNSKGISRRVKLVATTPQSALWKSDVFEPVVVAPIIMVVMCFTGAVVIISVILLGILKLRSSPDSKEVSVRMEPSTSNQERNNVNMAKAVIFEKTEDGCPDIIPSETLCEYSDKSQEPCCNSIKHSVSGLHQADCNVFCDSNTGIPLLIIKVQREDNSCFPIIENHHNKEMMDGDTYLVEETF